MKKHPDHAGNLVALRRIEGQVRGVQNMIESNKGTVDILTQIYAVKGALNRIEEKILENYLQLCVCKAVKASKHERQQKIDEILKLIHRIHKM